jgi:hypothetical protein
MSKLQFKLPENFEPISKTLEDAIPKFKEPSTQIFIYSESGNPISYIHATPDQIKNWIIREGGKYCLNANASSFIEADSVFKLNTNKIAVLDLIIKSMIWVSTELLGGHKFWESVEEWQRLQKMEERDRKP